jgi:hypothetical protein
MNTDEHGSAILRMNSKTHPELEDRAGRPLPSGRPVKCVGRNGANEKLGTVAHELDAILSRPLNHKLRLTGVFDLASKDAGHQHLIFVVECLEEFCTGRTLPRTDDELAVLIFGALQKTQGVVSVKRVYRALNCKPDHFYGLTAGRKPALRLARNSAQRRGPGGSAMVAWAELVRFLGERRVA